VHQEALTVRREGDATGAAREEASANLRFKPTDVATQRLLRHVETIGSAGEVKLLGDGHEGAKDAEIEIV
jgi:hypothetical protein